MAGLFAYSVAGVGFLLIGTLESLSSGRHHPPPFRFASTAAFSSLAVLNSLLSLASALNAGDHVGVSLQLASAAAASLFLLYSFSGLLAARSHLLPLPPSALDLVCLFAFGQEFFLFYLQRKDTAGIENRYFDLLLVPILVCIVSTVLSIARPGSLFPRLARGLGLVLQGLWLIQMGFSFFSGVIAQGCYLHSQSRGNYTVKCKGHPEYHRGRAIATLQFNGHLAFLTFVAVVAYSFVSGRPDALRGAEYSKYRPLKEIQRGEVLDSRFTLDSDHEGEKWEGETVGEVQGRKQPEFVLPVVGVNGFGGSH